MIWLAWRQHRRQVLVTAIGLAALAALLIPTGLAMRDTYADLGVADCISRMAAGEAMPFADDCMTRVNQFTNRYGPLAITGVLFLVLPLLIGLFWGAPLVAREVEHGTHRFVWTQGIGRRRWLLVKLALATAVAFVAAAVYGLGVSWWMGPLTSTGEEGRFDALFFDMQGVAPIGYTLFALALGVFAGTVRPRVLTAMVIALGGFIGVRILLTVFARPHLMPPLTRTSLVTEQTGDPTMTGDWVIEKGVRNADGTMVAEGASVMCPRGPIGPGGGSPAPVGPDGGPCGARLGLDAGAYNWQQYQPADRFWAFQFIEAGIFLALAAVLLYLAVRRIRRIA